MSLNEKFDKAVEEVKKLRSQPGNDDLLIIYGLFKQATIGDCNTDKPGFLDFKGKSKWDAWKSNAGIEKDAAKEAYVAKVQALVDLIGVN